MYPISRCINTASVNFWLSTKLWQCEQTLLLGVPVRLVNKQNLMPLCPSLIGQLTSWDKSRGTLYRCQVRDNKTDYGRVVTTPNWSSAFPESGFKHFQINNFSIDRYHSFKGYQYGLTAKQIGYLISESPYINQYFFWLKNPLKPV